MSQLTRTILFLFLENKTFKLVLASRRIRSGSIPAKIYDLYQYSGILNI